MSEELVKRLRDVAEATGPNEARQIALAAADRIEELEAKLEKAVEALEKLARLGNGTEGAGPLMARRTLRELKGQDDE